MLIQSYDRAFKRAQARLEALYSPSVDEPSPSPYLPYQKLAWPALALPLEDDDNLFQPVVGPWGLTGRKKLAEPVLSPRVSAAKGEDDVESFEQEQVEPGYADYAGEDYTEEDQGEIKEVPEAVVQEDQEQSDDTHGSEEEDEEGSLSDQGETDRGPRSGHLQVPPSNSKDDPLLISDSEFESEQEEQGEEEPIPKEAPHFRSDIDIDELIASLGPAR